MNHTIIIHTPLGEDLKFVSFKGNDALSISFEFTVEMQSENKDLAAPDTLRKYDTIAIELKGGAQRCLNAQFVLENASQNTAKELE